MGGRSSEPIHQKEGTYDFIVFTIQYYLPPFSQWADDESFRHDALHNDSHRPICTLCSDPPFPEYS